MSSVRGARSRLAGAGCMGAEPSLEERRNAAARHGDEVLLATDASVGELADLRESKLIAALADDLAARGIPLRLLPASYAPDERDRRRVSAWVDDDALCIGVIRGARAESLARAGARWLGFAEGYSCSQPKMGRLGAVLADAGVEAFTYRYLADLGAGSEALASLRRLGARVSERCLGGSFSDDARVSAAVAAWAPLSALPAEDAQRVARQLGRMDAPLGALVKRLLTVAPGPDAGEALRAIISG